MEMWTFGLLVYKRYRYHLASSASLHMIHLEEKKEADQKDE